MKHINDIYDELKDIAPFLAEQEKTNIFSVPEGYFSTLHIQILNSISEKPYSLPSPLPVLSGVPKGYFESLSGNILQKIKELNGNDEADELKQLSPVLHSISRRNVLTVPDKYFETFPSHLLQMVRPQAKVIVMKKRSMLWNSAAAAVLTGIMAVSALWLSQDSTHQSQVTAVNSITPLPVKDARQYQNEQQLNDGIATLSDADIIKYLETTGTSADDDMLASGIPEKELPDERDYLTDENTLQMFLKETESKKNQN